ncbi:phosphoserine phosphatase SerB [Alloscardovia venturai]|uniref:phosphoserine phosphatase n=1 Tax=Alloscardovia venturai TaxID=1769421 RepID=A0ABW2Y6T9_9BIFI
MKRHANASHVWRYYRCMKRLIVMDIDSTLIEEEVIDELGAACGHKDAIAEITRAAMNGEIDFSQALRQRVSLLRGLDTSIYDRVYQRLHVTYGAQELITTAHARGWKVGVVSGGFYEIADKLVADLKIDYCLAHTLGVQTDGTLDGTVTSPIVTKDTKLSALRTWAEREGIPLSATVAIGDGANDIPMIQAAGIGIAFCAKPVTRQAAPYHIDERNLSSVLDIISHVYEANESLRGTRNV